MSKRFQARDHRRFLRVVRAEAYNARRRALLAVRLAAGEDRPDTLA